MNTHRLAAWMALAAALGFAATAAAAQADYRALPGGTLRTVLPPDGKQAPARVAPFALRALPVTNAEFLAFVRTHPEWRRDRTPAVFADGRYLAHWTAADALGDGAPPRAPVTQVSWFAARAYCEAEGGRLPTWHEWEFAAAADETRQDARDDPAWRERLLSWYSRPTAAVLPDVDRGPRNAWGVGDLHGLVWEWVDDVAAMMIGADNREQGDPDLLAFCGAGALAVGDRENYAVLMRTAMLSSLQPANTTRNLGFRCARELPETPR